MKKILYFLFSILFISNIAFAQDLATQMNTALNTTTMPSDEQIMQMINKFGLPQDQKELLFQQTKQQLQQLYETKNADALIQSQFGSYENAQNMLPEIEKMMQNSGSTSSNERVKKYSNHPPLTR